MKLPRTVRATVLGFVVALCPSAFANTFVVNDAGDRETGDPVNCPTQCFLRDALAAADATPGMDTILFLIDDTIFITKQLTAFSPVVIDGGPNRVTIRVAQGYTTKTLADRFRPYQPITVLQPEYYSVNSFDSPQAMLVLLGHGSHVSRITLDGSITPRGGDGQRGVSRADFDSDDLTDTFLYTVNNRWLVANGLYTQTSAIESNEVQYVRQYGINVNNAWASHIVNNRVRGGAAGQYAVEGVAASKYAGAGIWVVNAAMPVVAGNHISQYHSGIDLLLTSGVSVQGNQLKANSIGISIDSSDDSFGASSINDNDVHHNLEIGISVNLVAPSSPATVLSITNNRVKANRSQGIRIVQAAFIRVADNVVDGNGSGALKEGGIEVGSAYTTLEDNTVNNNRGFGVVVAGPLNVIGNNTMRKNLGAGLVLFQGSAQYNTITGNTSRQNEYGILSFSLDGTYPQANTISYNQMLKNKVADAADADPACANYWVNNTYETGQSAGCIQ
jgi:parallel beta-helix repeat protein